MAESWSTILDAIDAAILRTLNAQSYTAEGAQKQNVQFKDLIEKRQLVLSAIEAEGSSYDGGLDLIRSQYGDVPHVRNWLRGLDGSG